MKETLVVTFHKIAVYYKFFLKKISICNLLHLDSYKLIFHVSHTSTHFQLLNALLGCNATNVTNRENSSLRSTNTSWLELVQVPVHDGMPVQ